MAWGEKKREEEMQEARRDRKPKARTGRERVKMTGQKKGTRVTRDRCRKKTEKNEKQRRRKNHPLSFHLLSLFTPLSLSLSIHLGHGEGVLVLVPVSRHAPPLDHRVLEHV